MSRFPIVSDRDHCAYPDCAADLLGDPIPEGIREHYSPPYHWRRELMVEIRGVYDGGLFYICPDCRRPYHRWPPESFQYRAAEQHMQEWVQRASL